MDNRSLPSTSALEGLGRIDVGKSGSVYALDARRVVKRYDGDDDDEIRAEREVYDRLGHHPDIAEFLGALGRWFHCPRARTSASRSNSPSKKSKTVPD